ARPPSRTRTHPHEADECGDDDVNDDRRTVVRDATQNLADRETIPQLHDDEHGHGSTLNEMDTRSCPPLVCGACRVHLLYALILMLPLAAKSQEAGGGARVAAAGRPSIAACSE